MAARLEQLAAALPELSGHVLAGVSGGADSVTLLRLLVCLRETRGLTVEAVHVNHGLRGEASDGDETFVKALCAGLGVPLHTCRAMPPADPGEDWARRVRYGFFRQVMGETGADALVLAHHMDDQAETLLLHLLRGAGLNGLAGMAPETMLDGMRVLRPLLGVTRQQLREALLDAGQPWREDASNADTRYLRNAVRHDLLPMMERLAPGASAHLAGTAGLLRIECERNAAQTQAFLGQYAGRDWLLLAPLMAQPPAAQADILRAWWQEGPGSCMAERSLDRRQTETMMALIGGRNGAACSLPGRWEARRGWKCLHLVPPERIREQPGQEMQPMDNATMNGVTLTLARGGMGPGDGRICQEIPGGMLAGCVLRTRRPGDWLRPYGSAGRQSLQDYFVNRRVDAPFRARIPLLCRGSEVLLISGVGAGVVPAWDPEEDNIRLVWQGCMPWA